MLSQFFRPSNSLKILGLLLLSSCALFAPKTRQLTVFHYNILELDSPKIQNGADKVQMESLKKFLSTHLKDNPPNLISINEVQFDKPQVPTNEYMTYGQNVQLFLNEILGKSQASKWNISFTEANTGANAKKYKGNYLSSQMLLTRKLRNYADQVNYGLFPGQYSTALASRFPVTQKVELKKLTWRAFNPKAPLHKYRNARGRRLPKDIELFDKSFNDTIIDVDGQPVHVITLHTVPAYHFGNKRSPNYQRNRDQLRFLEWYLTGKTDIEVNLPEEFSYITPLSKDDTYIAMGDWNTDISNLKNPGSKILKRLSNTGRLFPTSGHTYESKGYDPKRSKMLLDYIFHSDDLFLKEAHVVLPKEKRLFLGCGKKSLSQKEEVGRHWVTFKENSKSCHVTVSDYFYSAKNSSDHFPLTATFELRRK